MKTKMKVFAVLALVVATAYAGFAADPGRMTDRLSRRGASGRIAVRAGGKHLPDSAEVTFARMRAGDMERRVKSGVEKHRAKHGRKGAANA